MTTIKRKIDNLGRMVIPNDMRELLGIKSNDMLLIATDGEQLIIRPMSKACPICGCKLSEGNLVCEACLEEIKNELMNNE